MVSIRYEGRFEFDAVAFIERRKNGIFNRFEKLKDEAVEKAKEYTRSRPSAKSGRSGRVDKGNMEDDLTGRVTQSLDQIAIELGFLNRAELYYVLQTQTGFTHWISGEYIAPTYALRDAALFAEDEMRKIIKQEMGRSSSGRFGKG